MNSSLSTSNAGLRWISFVFFAMFSPFLEIRENSMEILFFQLYGGVGGKGEIGDSSMWLTPINQMDIAKSNVTPSPLF